MKTLTFLALFFSLAALAIAILTMAHKGRVAALPLLALATTWRITAEYQKEDAGKRAYHRAAKELEEWIKVGTLRLEP